MFGRRDGHLATIDDVNARADVARGTFYNYFASRDDLLTVLAFELSKDFNDAIIRVLADVDDAAMRTSIGVRHYVAKAAREPEWGWATVNIAMNGQLVADDTLHHLGETIRRGLRAGRLRSASEAAAIDLKIGAMLTAMLSVLGTEGDHALYLTEMMVMLLRGLGLPTREATRIAEVHLPALDVRDCAWERSLAAVTGRDAEAKPSPRRAVRKVALFPGRGPSHDLA